MANKNTEFFFGRLQKLKVLACAYRKDVEEGKKAKIKRSKQILEEHGFELVDGVWKCDM